MTLNITSKQMEITPAIREHVEGRLAKLEKWHTQLISPHFVLSKVPNGFSVEASIGTPLGNGIEIWEDIAIPNAANTHIKTFTGLTEIVWDNFLIFSIIFLTSWRYITRKRSKKQ